MAVASDQSQRIGQNRCPARIGHDQSPRRGPRRSQSLQRWSTGRSSRVATPDGAWSGGDGAWSGGDGAWSGGDGAWRMSNQLAYI